MSHTSNTIEMLSQVHVPFKCKTKRTFTQHSSRIKSNFPQSVTSKLAVPKDKSSAFTLWFTLVASEWLARKLRLIDCQIMICEGSLTSGE